MANSIVGPDPYNKTCKYSLCKESFTARRGNMEYCKSDCKKKANNGKARQFALQIKNIVAQHKLNWKVLDTFYNLGKVEITEELLRQNKFNYSKSTGVRNNQKNERIPEYYNYALEQIRDKTYKIIKLW